MLSHNWQHLSLYHSTWQFYYTLIFFFFWFWQLMCDLINNHADGGEDWTVMCGYIEKSETIMKGKATQRLRKKWKHSGFFSPLFNHKKQPRTLSLPWRELRHVAIFPARCAWWFCADGLKWQRPGEAAHVDRLCRLFPHTNTMLMLFVCLFVCLNGPDKQMGAKPTSTPPLSLGVSQEEDFDVLVHILFTHQL